MDFFRLDYFVKTNEVSWAVLIWLIAFSFVALNENAINPELIINVL